MFSAFKKEHSSAHLGNITVGSVVGGMRGMAGVMYETSSLHHINGINYRNKNLYEIRDQAPRAKGGSQPLPEGVLWLLLTGELPNEKEMSEF